MPWSLGGVFEYLLFFLSIFWGEMIQVDEQTVTSWNPNDLYFWRLTPQNKAFSNQNKGHLSSRILLMKDFPAFTSW